MLRVRVKVTVGTPVPIGIEVTVVSRERSAHHFDGKIVGYSTENLVRRFSIDIATRSYIIKSSLFAVIVMILAGVILPVGVLENPVLHFVAVCTG